MDSQRIREAGEITAEILAQAGFNSTFDGRVLTLGNHAISITKAEARAIEERGEQSVARDVIERHVKTDWTLAKSAVLPIVRESSYYEGLSDIVRVRVAEDLLGHVAFLGLGTLETMARTQVDAFSVKRSTVVERAISNLENYFPNAVSGMNGLYDIESPALAPSFMLLPHRLPESQDGDRIAWPVTRNLLLVTGHQNRRGLEHMQAFVAELGEPPMIDSPFRLTAEGWRRHS